MNDLIKKSDAMRIVHSAIKAEIPFAIVSDLIKGLPSADAVQGEWIMHGEPPWYVRECSKCGTKWHQWSGDSNPNYCGHCGARMKGGAEE